ncbi:hypothetical protein GGX14DRAFT_568214 [Mycena pura]|uniref:Uncharacterized protein n=1 Tax=Mycena pura TaxID=153505 RepID=A0AAD6Y872_9AGAR|nr:hypothetical protein GGX14DRAFT_568214 [Mycena pura]
MPLHGVLLFLLSLHALPLSLCTLSTRDGHMPDVTETSPPLRVYGIVAYTYPCCGLHGNATLPPPLEPGFEAKLSPVRSPSQRRVRARCTKRAEFGSSRLSFPRLCTPFCVCTDAAQALKPIALEFSHTLPRAIRASGSPPHPSPCPRTPRRTEPGARLLLDRIDFHLPPSPSFLPRHCRHLDDTACTRGLNTYPGNLFSTPLTQHLQAARPPSGYRRRFLRTIKNGLRILPDVHKVAGPSSLALSSLVVECQLLPIPPSITTSPRTLPDVHKVAGPLSSPHPPRTAPSHLTLPEVDNVVVPSGCLECTGEVGPHALLYRTTIENFILLGVAYEYLTQAVEYARRQDNPPGARQRHLGFVRSAFTRADAAAPGAALTHTASARMSASDVVNLAAHVALGDESITRRGALLVDRLVAYALQPSVLEALLLGRRPRGRCAQRRLSVRAGRPRRRARATFRRRWCPRWRLRSGTHVSAEGSRHPFGALVSLERTRVAGEDPRDTGDPGCVKVAWGCWAARWRGRGGRVGSRTDSVRLRTTGTSTLEGRTRYAWVAGEPRARRLVAFMTRGPVDRRCHAADPYRKLALEGALARRAFGMEELSPSVIVENWRGAERSCGWQVLRAWVWAGRTQSGGMLG